MELYSIGGVDLAVEKLSCKGGYRIGDEEHFRLRNCEWVADCSVHRGWRAPQIRTIDLVASFAEGNHPKFHSDLDRIALLAAALFDAAGAVLSIRAG